MSALDFSTSSGNSWGPSIWGGNTNSIASWGVGGGDTSVPSNVRGAGGGGDWSIGDSGGSGQSLDSLLPDNGTASIPGSMGGMSGQAGASNPLAAALGSKGGQGGNPLTKPGDMEGGGFGLNIPTARLGLGLVNTLGNLYFAWQANEQAKKQFAYTKNITEQNLANSMENYNTQLQDKARARERTEEGQAGATNAASYVAEHKLVRRP